MYINLLMYCMLIFDLLFINKHWIFLNTTKICHNFFLIFLFDQCHYLNLALVSLLANYLYIKCIVSNFYENVVFLQPF